MQKVTQYPDGSRQIHTYEEMPPHKRPQDPHRDGTGLRFETQEHHGYDLCPEAITLIDSQGRRCIYLVEDEFSDTSARPRDLSMDGAALRFEILEYGGEYPDDMPQAGRVSDAQGRSCIFRPVMEDGKVVDSKGFSLIVADSGAEAAQVQKREGESLEKHAA